MSKITIISAPYCSYCLELKERLDKLDLKFNDVDITLEENKVECERLFKFTNSDSIPIIIVGKNILIPNNSFKTIEEASLLIEKLYKE
jgi:glutaredoxin